MPTICHEFEKRHSSVDWARRYDRWRSSQRSARRSCPLRILMIKALPMIMVRERVED
jgi:hypothetical protein